MDLSEQMKFFFEVFHSSLPRLGPGTTEATLRALKVFDEAGEPPNSTAGSERPQVLDLGCGNGAQTLVLAKETDWPITAVDNHKPFLDELERRALGQGLQDRMALRQMDMSQMDFEPGSFEVVWSEGALYSMGVAAGLAACHRLLVPGGVMAFTELCWLVDNPSDEAREYFETMYPDIRSVEDNLDLIDATGFDLVEHFALPPEAWWNDFYLPLEERSKQLAPRAVESPGLAAVLSTVKAEIEMYSRHSDEYGYVFYCLKGR
jgi:SAM-dependent methyltransferase